MTKRTKLLSLMVTAVLCFVAGFAVMFGTTSAKADVAVPEAPYSAQLADYDWATGKNFNQFNVTLNDGKGFETADVEWLVFDYYLPAGVSYTGSDVNVNFALSSSYVSTAPTADVDGTSVKATYVAPATSAYIANAGATDARARFAINLADGKIYASAGEGAFVEVAAFSNIAYMEDVAKIWPYFNIGADPSVKRINSFRMYTEDFNIDNGDYNVGNGANFHAGGASFRADKIVKLNIPATAVKPYGAGKDYEVSTNFSFKNKLPTTAEWIIFEYTLTASTVYTNAQNGLFSYLSTYDYTGNAYEDANGNPDENIFGELHSFSGDVISCTQLGDYLFHAHDAETNMKIAINTKTGDLAIEKAGTIYSYPVYAGANFDATLNKFWGIMSNGGKVSGALNDLVCYDSNGAELGVIVGGSLSLVPPVIDDASIRTEGVSVVSTSTSTARVVTAVPVTSNWIFFEWTNGVNEWVAEGSKPGGAGFWIVATDSLAKTSNPPVYTKDENMYFAAMQTDEEAGYTGLLKGGRTTRIGISLADACMPAVWYNGVKGTLSAPLNLNFSFANPINNGHYYVGLWMNAIYDTEDGFSATGLRCFDENGNNIDITLTLMDYTAKTVTFMNGSSEHAKYENAMPGNSFAQFTDLTTPSGSGNFVGWTATNGGLDFVNISDAVPAAGATVYARFMSAEMNVADYAGVYKCEETKRYFEITADGDLISYVPGLTSGDVRVFEESGTTVYSLGANVSKSNVANQITIGNDVYVKTNDYNTVKYMFDGAEFASIKVPTGYLTVSNLAPKKTGHTFVGWYVGEAKFNFGSAINADVTLTAKLSVNEAPEASYELYTFNYYNKAEDTLYIINADKTYAKISAGVKTTGTYGLLVDGSTEYLVFDGDLDNAFRVDNVSADIAGNHYVKLFDEYTITFVLGGKLENVVEIVDAESGYLVTMPEDPTREGYVFKGWAYGDGTEFDGSLIQANTCEVYAVWEAVEGGTESGGGIGALTIIAIVVAAVVALGGVAVFVLWKKGILFAGK